MFSEASECQNHSEVLYLNLFKKTTTCVVAKPLVSFALRSLLQHKNAKKKVKKLVY